jgi:hypothetical protein
MARAVWVTTAAVLFSIVAAHRPAHAQPAQTPPRTPAPEGDGFEERGGITLGVQLGGGSGVMFGAELGGMVRHDLAIIGTATALVRGAGGVGFLGLGARYWLHHIFVDAQLGQVSRTVDCEADNQCEPDHLFGGVASIGFELAQTQHFGLDFHASTLVGHLPHELDAVWFAGMGIHAYF